MVRVAPISICELFFKLDPFLVFCTHSRFKVIVSGSMLFLAWLGSLQNVRVASIRHSRHRARIHGLEPRSSRRVERAMPPESTSRG